MDYENENMRINLDFLMELKDSMDEQEVVELSIDASDDTFQIISNEQANFFLRKLEELRNETKEIEAAAASEIERLTSKITLWCNTEKEKNAKVEERFLNLLEVYAAKELEGSSKKSIKLPFGTLSFKKTQDKYEYDEKVLTNFLESDPELKKAFVSYKASPKKIELKKATEVKDGEMYFGETKIPGVVITTDLPDKFDAK